MCFEAHLTDAKCIRNLMKQLQFMVICQTIRKQTVTQICQNATVVSRHQYAFSVF